jgi:hypothetical protein
MKWLWTMLGLIVAAGAAALVWPTSQATDPPPSSPAAVVPPRPAVAPGPPQRPTPAPAASVPSPQPPSATTAVSAPEVPSRPAKASPEQVLAEPPAGGLRIGLDRSIPNATVAPGALMKGADGVITADGRYRIEGEGTREKPYRVTWDLLASANKTYVPRLKENRLPQRVAMLDGAWVRIDGYVAFPLMLQESREILAMLNQWDGCCIGVPPTPYDAIEVKLLEPVKPNRRHAFQYGSVTGRFKVDPLLVENWLVGLYQLEEAELVQNGL